MTPVGAQIAAAATRAGCTVRELAPDAGDGARATVECTDGWGAARLLVELAEADARRPEVRALAHSIATIAGPELEARARAVAALVTRRVRFEREPGEQFQGPLRLLVHGVGDCDCHVRAVYALCRALGVPVRAAFLHSTGGQPRHVAVQVAIPEWTWIDTTLQRRGPGGELEDAAELGEHPIAAAHRLGVLRTDVVPYREVTTMSGVGVDGGVTYRLRCLVQTDSYDLPDRPEACVRAALEALGFEVQSVWISRTSLPEGWDDGGGELPSIEGQTWGLETTPGGWLAWAEALYTEPECRVLDPATTPVSLVVTSVRARELAPSAPVPSTPSSSSLGSLGSLFSGPPKHTADLSDRFFVKLREMAGRLGAKPADLATLLYSESGLYPSADNRVGYVGLNQIHHSYLPAFGWEDGPEAYKRLTAEAQLEVVERFFARALAHLPRPLTLGVMYQANFVPASLARGTSPDTVVVAADGTGYGGAEATFYRDNRGFDRAAKGFITVRDLDEGVRARVGGQARLKEALERLGGGGTIPIAAVLPFVALAAALWYTKGA